MLVPRRLAPLLLALAACTPRKEATPSDAQVAATPSADAGSATAAGAPSAAISTNAAPTPIAPVAPLAPMAVGLCDLRWGFHGKVAGQEAFLRLARASKGGADVAGRYFYAKHGVDLALHGTLGPALELDLVEGDDKSPSGHFTGSCDPKTGALDGSWRAGTKIEPFHFDRIDARDKPLVATKRLKIARKAKHAGPGGGACEYEQFRFELFGAGTPEAELALDEQDARALAPKLLSKELHDRVDACEDGITASFSAGVTATFRGLVTIESSGTFLSAGAAHPANAVDFTRTTYSLATGTPITEKDLFAAFPKALVDRCVAAFVKASELEDFAGSLDAHHFDLRPAGVHFYGTEYPHAIAALTGAGPTVRWEALLRDKALRADSPAKRAWEGLAPAAAPGNDASDCVMDTLEK